MVATSARKKMHDLQMSVKRCLYIKIYGRALHSGAEVFARASVARESSCNTKIVWYCLRLRGWRQDIGPPGVLHRGQLHAKLAKLAVTGNELAPQHQLPGRRQLQHCRKLVPPLSQRLHMLVWKIRTLMLRLSMLVRPLPSSTCSRHCDFAVNPLQPFLQVFFIRAPLLHV